MRAWLLSALVVALLLPTAHAAPVEEACLPPCGYIVPLIDMQFETKMLCIGAGSVVTKEQVGPPADCEPMLKDGETKVWKGKLTIEWEVSEEGTYPKETGQDIVVSFAGSSANHKYLKYEMTPNEFLIDDAELLVANYEVRERPDGTQSVWFYYERDIELTITRDGEPSAKEIQSVRDRNGLVHFFIKAASTESSSRFKGGFAVEEFRFSAVTDEAINEAAYPWGFGVLEEPQKAKESPGLSVGVLLLGLMVLIRRRQ